MTGGLGTEGLWGLWFLVQMTQQHPGAPGPKKQWLQCAGNIDTTCPPFLPSPACYRSLPTTSCSFAPALAGREQGMLIKGCENQEGEKKKGGFIGIPEKGKIAGE